MAKKHVNDNKPAGYGGKSVSGNKSSTRSNLSNKNGGERNVGTHGAEEHSRVPKGNR